MSLTRVKFENLNTNVIVFNDNIVVSNYANPNSLDIGELYDRSGQSKSNVAVIWQESTSSFRLAYTSSDGTPGANITVTGNANVRVGNLYAESINWANGSAFTSSTPGGSDTQLQYNSSGSFAGASGLTTNGTNLTSTGTIAAVTVNAATIGNSGATLTGTLSTAAQTSITSLGTLTGLTLSGTLNGTIVQATTIGNSGAALTGATVTATTTVNGPLNGTLGVAGGNTAVVTTLSATSNATVSGLTVNSSAVVNNSLQSLGGIQNTPIGNATASTATFTTATAATINAGTVNAATIGNSGATLTGTIQTAAQSNITSVGTLTGLTVGGTVNAATLQAATIGNVGASFTGNGYGLSSIVTAGTATYVTNATQSNITAVGTLTGLTLSGTLNGTTLQAATIGNASAVFTGATYTASSSFNGPHNGTLGVAGGNTAIVSTLSATGNATVSALTVNNSATITTLGISGNATIGNILSNNYYFANGAPFVSSVPGGTTGQFQYNTSTNFGGSAYFNYVSGNGQIIANAGINSTSNVTGTMLVTGGVGTTGNIYAENFFYANGVAVGSTTFTVITANTQNGDNTTTAFTVPIGNATTAGTIVAINGVLQQTTTAYSVTSANATASVFTFTEAPTVTDVIDFRVMSTTTIVETSVSSGTATFVTGNTQSNINAVGTLTSITTSGAIINDGSSVTVGTGGGTMDSWSGSTYKAAKYVVTARDSGSTTWTTLEALVVTNGNANAAITTYGIVNAGTSGTPQVSLSASASGGTVTVTAAGAAAGTVVNFGKNYIVGS